MRTFVTIALVFMLLVLARLSFYTVDAAEYAYVTVLGQHTATYDGGAEEGGAGLRLGWPWPVRAVQRLDRRLQFFDLAAREEVTHDPDGKRIDKTLSIEAYVCWKIADRAAVDHFIQRLGTPDRATAILRPDISGKLGAAINTMRMEDLVSIKPGTIAGQTRVDEKVKALRDKLLAELRPKFLKEYGIELVDIRLRRFSHPGDIREAIFATIRSERKQKVTEYQSEGMLQASKIESEAEEEVRTKLAQARADEETQKGKADAEAMAIRNQAHSQDPEFYAFLKKMDKLQSILGDQRTVLLLSTHRQMFESLFQPPRPQKEKDKKGGD